MTIKRHIQALGRRARDEQGGFTLIELLVASSLLVLVIGIALDLAVRSFVDQDHAISRSSTASAAQEAVERLIRDMRGASALTLSSTASSATATMTTRVSGADASVVWTCTVASTCTRSVNGGVAVPELSFVSSAAFGGVTTAGVATTSSPAFVTVTLAANVQSELNHRSRVATGASRPVSITDGTAIRAFS